MNDGDLELTTMKWIEEKEEDDNEWATFRTRSNTVTEFHGLVRQYRDIDPKELLLDWMGTTIGVTFSMSNIKEKSYSTISNEGKSIKRLELYIGDHYFAEGEIYVSKNHIAMVCRLLELESD